MNKKTLLLVLISGMVIMFTGSMIFAGNSAPDIIKMENALYSKHDDGIVMFGHKKHIDEYKAACGECHHDEDNKPLNDLKDGDEVQSCAECHKKTGKIKKGTKKKGKLEYHKEALHYNCKGCHKVFNKKNKTKAAPVTCKKCHPKKAK